MTKFFASLISFFPSTEAKVRIELIKGNAGI